MILYYTNITVRLRNILKSVYQVQQNQICLTKVNQKKTTLPKYNFQKLLCQVREGG